MPPKPKASDAGKNLGAPVETERQPRPLYAALTATAAAAQANAEGKKTNGGRWSLNAGSLMVTSVWGLNMERDGWGEYAAPIRLVVDLASAKFAKPVMPALGEHWWDKIIGNWANCSLDGGRIAGDLTIYEARTPAEAAVLPECVRAKALLEQGHPWQASIGAYPEDGIDGYEEVPEGESIDVNGVKLTADDAEMPLYVMRKAVITEASICTFGADQNTGPLAASARRRGQLAASANHPTTKTTGSAPMKYNLRAMLALFAAHAALAAEHVAAAQELPEDKQPTPEALQASIAAAVEKADAAAKLAEKDKRIAELEAAAAEKSKPVVKAGAAVVAPPFQGGSEEAGDAPATLHEAMAQLHGENEKLKGFALRAAALKRWPELRKTVPDAHVGTAR